MAKGRAGRGEGPCLKVGWRVGVGRRDGVGVEMGWGGGMEWEYRDGVGRRDGVGVEMGWGGGMGWEEGLVGRRDGVEDRGVGRREAWRALLHLLKEGKCLRPCCTTFCV